MNAQAPFKHPLIKYLNKTELSIIILIITACAVLSGWLFNDGKALEKVDWFSFSVGILMSIPVALIWFNQLKNRWISSLPTYITVTLMYRTQKLAVVENVYIEKGADLRSQAQTLLGAVRGENIKGLEPFLRDDYVKRGEPSVDDTRKINNGDPYESILVTLFTTKEPTEFEECDAIEVEKRDLADASNSKSKFYIKHNWYWRWCPLCEGVNYKEKAILVPIEPLNKTAE